MRATFIKSIQRTEEIKSFRFLLQEKLEFLPGQFTQVIFDEERKDNRALNKYLSFSSSPEKEYIEVTKRISGSEFSGRLAGLRQGDTVLFKPPMGNCVFREEYKRAAFLIGGIGITPVISMIEYITEKKIEADIYLLYSNRSMGDIAFKGELDIWGKQHPEFRIVYDTGRIDKDMVLKHMPDFKERVVFMFGPPGMVTVMKNICYGIGCNNYLIKAENFIGY